MAQQSLTPNANIIANGLALPSMNSIKRAADISGQYSQFLKVLWMFNYNNPAGMSSISTIDGRRTTSRLQDTTRKQVIATVAASGANLVLTFTDPTYNLFRINDVLVDTVTGVQGKVIANPAGGATISPLSATAFSAITMFQPGKYASALDGVTAQNFNSTSPIGIFNDPTTDYNYTTIVREGESLARRNMASETMVQFNDKGWWTSYEQEMVMRCFGGVEKRLLISERYTDGVTNNNGGLDWLIGNRGGTTVAAAAPPSLQDINDWLQIIITANATPTTDIFCFCGMEFYANFQSLVTTNSRYITNLGARETINGMNVANYNVNMYNVLGVKVTFMQLPILNYKNFWAEPSTNGGLKKSWTAYFLNMAPIPVMGGGTVPALELFYFNQAPIYYGYVGGTVDINGFANAGQLSAASFSGNVNMANKMTSTDVDGVQAWILADMGVDAVDTKAMLKFEITQ